MIVGFMIVCVVVFAGDVVCAVVVVVFVVVVVDSARDGRRNVGGRRVRGVRSSKTERNNDLLILEVEAQTIDERNWFFNSSNLSSGWLRIT